MQFIDKIIRLFKRPEAAKEKFVVSELSEEFLRHWVKRLKFFRYVKSRGGFDGDIDKLFLALHYGGQEDLISVLDGVGISYKIYQDQPPRPERGRSYSGMERANFPSVIPGTYWIEQPGWQTINSIPISVRGETDRLQFTIVGPKEKHWQITETEFEHAEQLETIFEKYIKRIIDPPIDANNCICPKYYPQYW